MADTYSKIQIDVFGFYLGHLSTHYRKRNAARRLGRHFRRLRLQVDAHCLTCTSHLEDRGAAWARGAAGRRFAGAFLRKTSRSI